MKQIRIFDTTLRDGEQTPGVHFSHTHKLEIARQLEKLGVNIIEAGFPASSPGDLRCVKDIADEIKICTVAALARCSESDINAAWEALKNAAHPRIHVFIATSDIHMQYKLKMTREQVLDSIKKWVSYASSLCTDIEFSCEDASRTDPDFLCEAVMTAVKSGASTVNIPDTVGYALPDEFGKIIARIRSELDAHESESGKHIYLSAHCHNDLGCAVACSIAAVENGADQLETAVNGIGERAGNAALEECVMAIYTRSEQLGVSTDVNTTQITRTSRLVSSLSGIPIPPNKAVVGGNAFAHEAGIHQHGILADRRTYEIMTPETIGLSSSNLVLGKLSGRHAFADRIAELGYSLSPEDIDECFARFKSYADKRAVSDEDIMAIVNEQLDARSPVYELDSFQIQSGNKVSSMAMIRLGCSGVFISDCALGDGPIDASFNAVNRLSGASDVKLEEYSIKAVTEGADALGEARVRVSIDGASYSGRGVSTDILEASIKAYISALNKWAKGVK